MLSAAVAAAEADAAAGDAAAAEMLPPPCYATPLRFAGFSPFRC